MSPRPERRRSRIVSLVLALSLAGALAAAPPAPAWGPTGHRVVGRLASGHLSTTARRAVEDLLAPDSLAETATWADDIRSDPASAKSLQSVRRK